MQAANPFAILKVVEVVERSSFQALEYEWNRLIEETVNEPFFRHEFIRSWIDNFAATAKLRILTARDLFGKLVAVLPLMEEQTFFYGLPVKQLSATANPHSSRFDLIAIDGETAGQAFFKYLSADKSWDIIKIIDVPENGNSWHFLQAAKKFGFPVGSWISQHSPYIDLPTSTEELMKGLNAKFRGNLRRRYKQLQSQGEITVEKVSRVAELDRALSQAFAIELRSWKSRNGTGVAQHKQVDNFYRQLAAKAAASNSFALYFLKLNGQEIAFQYGLICGNSYSLPKTGFDEAYKSCSPGHLLQAEVVKDCIHQGLTKFDFLGDSVGAHMDWKKYWSTGIKTHKWLFTFRDNSIGQALCRAKFSWIPTAKQLCYKVMGREFMPANLATFGG